MTDTIQKARAELKKMAAEAQAWQKAFQYCREVFAPNKSRSWVLKIMNEKYEEFMAQGKPKPRPCKLDRYGRCGTTGCDGAYMATRLCARTEPEIADDVRQAEQRTADDLVEYFRVLQRRTKSGVDMERGQQIIAAIRAAYAEPANIETKDVQAALDYLNKEES